MFSQYQSNLTMSSLKYLFFVALAMVFPRISSQQLRVITLPAAPIVQRNSTGHWEGFAVDLLDKLKDSLDFSYKINQVKDGKYGTLENGQWSGMIGELVRGEADLAIGALSISADREMAVDFTETFYDLVGITIMRRARKSSSWMFEFMVAFKQELWIALGGVLAVTVVLLTLIERLSPYSWTNTEEETCLDADFRKFSLKESVWFCVTTLSPQGGGETPRNVSGKVLVVTYWLFAFIVLETFTANLAAYLTVSKSPVDITSIEDLASQASVDFFIRQGTFVESYFRRRAQVEESLEAEWRSDILSGEDDLPTWQYPMSSEYRRLWRRIQANQMVGSTEEAIAKVKDSRKEYAYIGDAAEIKYAIETDVGCGLESVGEEFSRQPYAIALPQITAEILSMATKLVLSDLADKWWLPENNPAIIDKCRAPAEATEEAGINLGNFGGSLVVVAAGLALCVPALLAEYAYYSRQ